MSRCRRPAASDLTRVATPSDPTVSPDGSAVVYTLRTVDTDADENIDRLWLAGPGARPRALTRGRADSGARFSPDGRRIAFLRGDGGPRQLWLLSFDGTEPEQLTTFALGAGTPVWSPEGTRLAFAALVDLNAQDGDAQDGDAAQHADKNAAIPITTDRLVHKVDGFGRLGGVRRHVFVLDLADRSVQRVTRDAFRAGTPTWSPDGGFLAYVDSLAEQTDRLGESSAFVVDLQQESEPRRIGPSGGVVADVAWTRAGLLLVCAPTTQIANLRLAHIASTTGELDYLTKDLDRNVMPGAPGYPGARPDLAADHETVLFCARDRGCTHLYGLAGDDPWKLIDGDRVVSALSVATDAPFAATVVADVDSMGEVVLVDLAHGTSQALTSHSAEQLGDTAVIAPQERIFTTTDGGTVHGWLIRDPDVDGRAPLLVDVHGGPHNAWHPARDVAHHYHQVLAARGWTVLLLNPRGSDGYGEAFLRGAVGAWGEADERDLLDPIDELVAEGIADARRIALCGYSYGGYLACWLSTRTDRFAAIVAGGVVSDLNSMAGTSDIGVELLATDLGIGIGEDPARVARLSPITHAASVTTPTLILHGQADQRCPVGQAEQWFTALRARGVTAELVVYPAASHTFILDGKPTQRADYDRRIVDWVVQHTRAAAPAGARSAAVVLDQEHWQRRLRSLTREHGIVGASLAIGFGDQRAEAACGVLHQHTGAPVMPDSLFHIGSISKVYTATAALRLATEGKLELDAPIADVLPELVLGDDRTAKRVSLRHLLTHTSGIEGDVFTDTGRGGDCLERFTEGLSEVGQLHPLGATWSYCNSGFVLVGRLIERVSGLVWDEAMRDLVFRPLGLTATVTLPEEVLCYSAAHGHVRPDNGGGGGAAEPAPRWHLPRSCGPAGSIVASAREVVEFARMHLRGGLSGNGTRILPRHVAEEMRSHQVTLPAGLGMADSWGLGWSRHDWRGRTIIGHDGNTIGQTAFLRASPEHELAVSLLTNGGPARDLHDALCREIFDELADIRPPAPDRPRADPPAIDTSGLTGVYERAGLRIEVSGEEATLVMRTVHTGTVKDFAPQPSTASELVPQAPGRFLTRLPGEQRWEPVVFYQLADGSPYVHVAGRAARKTS